MAESRTGFQRYARSFWLLAGALLLLSACGGLGGEPRIVATVPPRPTTQAVPDVGLPSAQPDLAQGARIYAERCTRCHGQGGRGDGELVLARQIPNPPKDFTDPATMQEQSLSEWFGTITNGRLDNLMPPWRDSLSETERWAVALYTYTMSYTPEQMVEGKAVWTAHCAECHGEAGAGDGPRAPELTAAPADLTRPEALIAASDAALFDTITQGKGEAMPAFADTLSDAERRVVAAYARTLSLTNPELIDQTVPAPATTPEVEVASVPVVPGLVSGQVTNATAGGQIPAGLVVTLHILDTLGNEETRETTVSADGRFSFADVPMRDDRGYMVTASYQDRLFSSELLPGNPGGGGLDLAFALYERTDDRTVLQIDNIIVQVGRAGDTLEIVQIMSYSNTSDRFYSLNEQVSDGRYASVVIPLPVGAQVMDFAADPQRYVFADNLTAVIDTRPVLPGSNHIVHLLYTLPYQDGMTVDLPLEYALSGQVQLLTESDSLQLSSDQLPALGIQSIGGAVYQSYGATLSLPVGDAVRFTVNSAAQSGQPGIAGSNNVLAYVMIAIGSVSLLAAATLYYLGRRAPAGASTAQLREVIIQEIAELDDLHAQGKIDPAAYQASRNRLKERLAKLLDK